MSLELNSGNLGTAAGLRKATIPCTRPAAEQHLACFPDTCSDEQHMGKMAAKLGDRRDKMAHQERRRRGKDEDSEEGDSASEAEVAVSRRCRMLNFCRRWCPKLSEPPAFCVCKGLHCRSRAVWSHCYPAPSNTQPRPMVAPAGG